jgi:NAD(P)H-hydrate epimerase
MGGLMAIAAAQQQDPESVVKTAVWWHAQAGRWAARERTDMGVDAYTLCQALIPTLGQMQQRGSAR